MNCVKTCACVYMYAVVHSDQKRISNPWSWRYHMEGLGNCTLDL